MTAKQAEVWSLYASGHRVTDIAIATGRSKGNVSSMIKAIKEQMKRPAEQKPPDKCEYSDSCFTCPLPDCVLAPNYAAAVNILPGDRMRV